ALLPLTFLLAVLAFFTEYADPTEHIWAGRNLAAPQVHSEIYAMRPDGAGQTRLAVSADLEFSQPAWSPDGRQIAFVAGAHGKQEIYVMASDGADPHAITSLGIVASGPAWSPDGREVAFTAGRGSKTEIYRASVSGGEPRRLTQLGVNSWGPA